MATKLDKLLSIRARIVGDLEHHIAEAKRFDTNSSVALVTFRSVALEKSHREFVDIGKELEKMSSFHVLGNLQAIVAKNRVCQDKYLEIKKHLSLLIQNENTVHLKTPFSYTSHRSCMSPSDGQNIPNQSHGLGLRPPHINSPHTTLIYTPQPIFEPIQEIIRPAVYVSNKQIPTISSLQKVNVQNKNEYGNVDDIDSHNLHSRNEVCAVCDNTHRGSMCPKLT